MRQALFDGMRRAAEKTLTGYLRVTPDETVLLIYDESTEEIAAAFTDTAPAAGVSLAARKIAFTGRGGADPDHETCELMKKYPVIIGATRFSLTHCPALTAARLLSARAATLPGITPELFARGLTVSPDEFDALGAKWLGLLSSGPCDIRVRSKSGSDIRFKTGLHPVKSDNGRLDVKGAVGNLPAGEVFIAPDEGTAAGTLVIDGSIAGQKWTPESEPAVIKVEKGRAVSFDGVRGRELEKTLSVCGPEALMLAEFGIGVNPVLKLGGCLLEDEKVLGAVHFAFGNNKGFGGTLEAPVHIDCVISNFTVSANGRTVD
jgi:leucyl aminopeptidase (aminopeptidase T)